MTESLLAIFSILLIHYLYFMFKVNEGLKGEPNSKVMKDYQPAVSVVVAFRNEEENILDNLKCLTAIDYPENKFEVIYIDDHSEDNTVKILNENITSKNFRVISTQPTDLSTGHKKNALNTGISQATGEIIFITDADCKVKPTWINAMLKCFDKNVAFVSGPVTLNQRNNLFGKFQKLEFAGLTLTGAGLIGCNKPIISSSANLAFRKKVFNSVDGYNDLMNLSSGDDDLLMQKIHAQTGCEIKFCRDENAIVETEPAERFSDFINQRRRWASKGFFYNNKLIVVKLIAIFFFYLGIILQLILGLLYKPVFIISLLVSFLLKIYIELQILLKGRSFLLNSTDLLYLPLFELIQIPYIVLSAILGTFGNFSWKNREVKR